MSKDEQKSKCEKTWAEIFFSYINTWYNFDYQTESLPNSISATDVIGISKSGKFPKLKTELTQALFFEIAENGIVHLDCNQVENAIDKKINDYQRKLINLEDIILLVQGNYDLSECEITRLKEKNSSSAFKGIYYLTAPSYNEEGMNGESVILIKNAFN